MTENSQQSTRQISNKGWHYTFHLMKSNID